MVTTRSGARRSLEDGESSSGDDTARRTAATLRPGKRAIPVASNARPPKRLQQSPGPEDDNVDAAINVTSMRRRPIEVVIGTSKGHSRMSSTDGQAISTKVPHDPSTAGVRGAQPRARRLNRHIQSIEILDEVGTPQLPATKRGNAARLEVAETPEPKSRDAAHSQPHVAGRNHQEVLTGVESPDQAQGSPELQSSALKRRPAKRLANIYDIPHDEELAPPSPVVARRPRTVNRLRSWSRPRSRRAPSHDPSFGRNARLSDIREEEQPEPSVGDRDGEVMEGRERPTSGQESDGFEREEGSEEVEESEDSDGDQSLVIIPVLPYNPSMRTIPIDRVPLGKLLRLMGRRGWTGRGRRWEIELPRLSASNLWAEIPTRTRLGKGCVAALGRLKEVLDEVPNALHLPGQSRYLIQEEERLNKAMTSVDNAVAKIEAVSTEPDRPASADARIPEPLFNDLCSCVIPMLVLVLQSAFAIGVKKPDAEAGNPLPEEGVFTVATAEILQWVLEWLSNLGELLKDEASDADQRPDPDSPAHDRDNFFCVLDVVKSRVRLAVDNFNEEEREIEEMKRKDMEIKEAKRRQEEEQLAAATWQDRLFSSSIRNILDQPRPFELLWRKFNPNWSGDAAHSSQRTTTTTPSTTTTTTTPARQRSVTTGTGSGTGTRSGTSASASARPPPSPPRPVADAPSPSPPRRNHPPWDEEDTEWFLQQLVRPDRRSGYLQVCAETLQRNVDDLLAEKERLKRHGRYRSPEWRR